MSKYLLTGGTGFIGSAFCEKLGYRDKVTILTRENRLSDERIRYINDLSEIKEDEEFDCIINLAGMPIDCRWTERNKELLVASRLSITEGIIDLIQRLNSKPKLLLSASAVGYYGSGNNIILDENYKALPSFTHTLCSQWEKKAELASKYGVRVCTVRLGVVLGRDKGFIKKTYLPFSCGLGGVIGSGTQYFPWIHVDDVIAGFKHLIANGDCHGPYNFTSPQKVNNKELTFLLGKILRRPTKLALPSWMVKIMFGEMGEELLLKGSYVYPHKLLQSGFKFSYDELENALLNLIS